MREEDKPREKALAYGMKSLTDRELMAILFGTGIKGKDVFALCNEILDDNKGHISRVAHMSANEFISRYKGIGPAKALTLLAGLELGVRAAADEAKVKAKKLCSSADAFEYMYRHLFNLDHEEFWILLLSRNLTPLREVRIGQGGLTFTAVDQKLIIREALLANASAIMLFHNHPSGQLAPSSQDVVLTRKIKDAAAFFDLHVTDHIIVGHNEFYSFHDEGNVL